MEEIKKLRVSFTPERLHSSIIAAMRVMHFPMNLPGADLIRGTVFGLVDHPDLEVEEAIEKAVEMSKLPHFFSSTDMAMEEMYYTIEAGACFVPEEVKDMGNIAVINYVIQKLCRYVERDYYMSLAYIFLVQKKVNIYDISFEILKNMIFKALDDLESNKPCIVKYAYRKTFLKNPVNIEEAEMKIKDKVSRILQGRDIFEYVTDVVIQIYEKNE